MSIRAGIQLRPSLPEDRDFIFRLYASTRMEELRPFGWAPAQQEAFLRMQFNAQQQWYASSYSTAETQIIEKDHEPIGRMIVQRERDIWRLLDISLLPEHRGMGIGGELVRALITQCAQSGAVLQLQVLNTNPAQRLYARLGFIKSSEDQIYTHMELRPQTSRPG
ncbi:MAG TPA: GNAT family N-acetyltransferase [Candidatus Binatia bacterium]|nr:GNAT family N-acetyltransferase [Candidatus Binatia bacterium]